MNKVNLSILCLLLVGNMFAQSAPDMACLKQNTICNPLNLSYRFCLNDPSRREAADPTMIVYKGEYYLFASKSGGYWHSVDLINWDLITTADLPLEDYAPTAVVIGDRVYFMASGKSPLTIYKTSDPKTGKWEIANSSFPIGMVDPDLFLDDDGRLYFYYGGSNTKPIYAVELDTVSLNPIGTPVDCFNSNMETYGWEQRGDYNNRTESTYIEGAWMTKYDGKYYLQYATPGTEFKSYCDGVYVSDKPLGPFKPAPDNPCSSKPEGFIAGAGHSSTFQDKYGNYWHISTMSISQKSGAERRLGLFPMFFDKDGILYTDTYFGDFPFTVPRKKVESPDELFPQWMLLSYHKPVEVSSELAGHPKSDATDEEIRTYWSAQTGNKGEWLTIDLLKQCTIKAVQVNFAENEMHLYGRDSKIYYQYLLEYSNDNKSWKTIVDKSQNKADAPHDFITLAVPAEARYVRLTNYYFPDGTFALAGLRIFGNGHNKRPSLVKKFTVIRTQTDRREVKLKWDKNPDAVGYNIRYGIQADKLYHNYQVLGSDSLTIRSLNKLRNYYFTIDSFNEKGVTKGIKTVEVD